MLWDTRMSDETLEELVSAFRDAIAVFSDVAGSGQDTLLKCERALRILEQARYLN